VLNALQVRVDLGVGAGYVKYRALLPGEQIASSARLTEDVVVDYDAAGQVLGIELIALEPHAIESAGAFASQNGLAFPGSTGIVGSSTRTWLIGART